MVDDLWTFAPRSGEDVVRVANWARRRGWRVRPRGKMHGWSPLAITPGTDCDDRVVMADTTRGLRGLEMVSESPGAVRAGAGETLEALTEFCRQRGYGFTTLPAVGDITIGGALTIGAHGAGIPGTGETPLPGQGFGSLSNLVVEITAVVWNRRRERYEERTFPREHRDCKVFSLHLGRSFVTSVVLRVAADQKIRCVSIVDVPVSRLFAPAGGGGGEAYEDHLRETGRADAIWFPFTDKPWLKVWSPEPVRPAGSRQVSSPYNYAFSDNIPKEVAVMADDLVSGNPEMAPAFGQVEYAATVAGLQATASTDIWGDSRNTLFYIKASTLRLREIGYAVITRRRDVQRAIHEFVSFFTERRDAYRAEGHYPINGPIEIRVTGLDRRSHVGIRKAQPPVLSPLHSRSDRRHWHAAIWFNVLTFPGTPTEFRFYRELERFFLTNYRGAYATARPEWSKSWAYSDTDYHVDRGILRREFPRRFSVGRTARADWDWARRRLNRYDPHRVFSNDFLDVLLP